MGKNLSQLTELAECPAVGDYLIIWDSSVSANRKVSYANFISGENFWARTSTTISPENAGDTLDMGAGSVLATIFDTNVAAAGVTLSGTTLAADGTDANISITLTPKGSGVVTTAKGYAMTGAVTTGFSISGATTQAISITGNASDAIKLSSGTFSTGINLGGTITTGITIGNCTTAINVGAVGAAADSRVLKGVMSVANANYGDGYGLIESELTLTGTTAGHVAALTSWINIATGTHSAGYICAQNNGVYEEAAATITNSKVIFGMRAQMICADTDAAGYYPFSINTNNAAITAIFDVNNSTDLGLVTDAGSDSGKLIPLYKDVNGNIGYVKVYSHS